MTPGTVEPAESLEGEPGPRDGGSDPLAVPAPIDDAGVRAVVEALLDGERPVVPVVQAGDPVLRHVAVPWRGQVSDATFRALVELMFRTMHDAPGVGLAAPQIGLPLQVAVLGDVGLAGGNEASDVRERTAFADRVLVNPQWRPVGTERVTFYEGCLSVDGWAAATSRWRTIELTAQDETGAHVRETLTGWPARIVQHEVDHLRGTLYLDHAESRSLSATDQAWRWAAEPAPRTAAAVLGFTLEG